MYKISLGILVGLCLSVTVARADIPDGLVAHWPLDEGTGTTTRDVSGNDIKGSFLGAPTWVAGKFGGALQLDGTDDCVDCGNPTILDFGTGDFTVTAWVKTTAAGDVTVVGKGGDNGAGIRWRLATNGGTLLILIDDDITKYDPVGNIRVSDDQWHFLVGLRRGTTLRGYVDGLEDAAITAHGDATIPASTDLSGTSQHNAYIGCIMAHDTGQTFKFFPGTIDDVAIWKRALTAEEITLLYTSGDPVPPVRDKGLAYGPSPAHKAKEVSRDVVLSWTPGLYAQTHNVYFGTSFDDVNSATVATPKGVLVSLGQDANVCDVPGVFQYGQTYYWRVDEVNAPPMNTTIFKGETWHFTVEPIAYKVPGTSITATASSSFNADSGPQKTVDGSGLSTADLHGTATTDMWLSAANQQPPVWIQYQFDQVCQLYEMWVWNSNNTLEWLLGLGVKTAVIEYSMDGITWTALANVPEFARAPSAAGYAHDTIVDFGGVAAQFVRLTVTSTWGGGKQSGLSEVRFFSIPVAARNPSPAAGATGVAPDTTLTWISGREAAEHRVYFSTDQQAVTNGTAPATTVTQASYSPSLSLGTTYYWRVDEVNAAQAISTWPGSVWSFTTGSFLVVDDMESYNDTTRAVYQTWLDGFGTTTNGCQVGNDNAPYMNTATVHGGSKSMPFRYNIGGTYTLAEATRTFDAQDWTASGIQTLRLFFYGNTANTAAGLYVKIDGTKISYTGDAAGVSKAEWTQWDIPLSSVPASTLQSVTSLTLGAATGTGNLLFDDIRLYPAAP